MNTNRGSSSSLTPIQEALALAKAEGGVKEEVILASIIEQRIRLKKRQIERDLSQQQKAAGAALYGLGRIESRSLVQVANGVVQGNVLLQAGRDFALQHPIAVGFFLGFGAIAFPRRLFKLTAAALPLIQRFSR